MVQLAQPMAPAMGGPRGFAPPQPVQQQRDPSATEMLTQMAQERAMGAAVDKGAELTATGMSKAGTAIKGALMPTASAGGAGMMAAMGTAMPYVGAGLLAGKALGLFSAGGQIGPLGNPSKVKYSYGGGKVEKEQVELTYGPLGGR